MPGILIVAAIVLLPLIWLIVNFNRFVRIRQHIRESWADIDVELKRRYDLIPNLVETVKGYARHERDVLTQVIMLRNKAQDNHDLPSKQAVDETALMIGMKKMFALVESYPELKADTQFQALTVELGNTEDRIAASRRFYNANVREFNQLTESFPTNIIASLFGFERQSYFELENAAERVVPRFSLS